MKRTDRTSGPGRNLPAISHVLRYCSCWHRRSLSASSPIVSTLVLATLILVGCNADTTPTEPAASRVEPEPVADPLAWLDAPQPEQRISTTLEELPASFPAGSPLKLHVASLKRVDIPLSTPLDIPAEPETFGEALADSLNQVGAEMVLHNNRLMIMAAREAQYALTTRIYDLSSVDTGRQTALARGGLRCGNGSELAFRRRTGRHRRTRSGIVHPDGHSVVPGTGADTEVPLAGDWRTGVIPARNESGTVEQTLS